MSVPEWPWWPKAYGLLENLPPLKHCWGQQAARTEKEQKQGNGRNLPNEGDGENDRPWLNNTRAPFPVAAEDRRGRSRAVASETPDDPSLGETQEDEFQMSLRRKGPTVESNTKSPRFKREQNDHEGNDSSAGSHVHETNYPAIYRETEQYTFSNSRILKRLL